MVLNGLKFLILCHKFPLKPNLWYYRALFDIVQDDAGPPILVWREPGQKNTSGYMTGKF